MAKAVNYTAEQVSALTAAYVAASDQSSRDEVVSEFAEKFGKSVASIRAKLSREQVYVKKERTRKDGSVSIKKAAKVAQLAARLGKPVEDLEYFEKLRHADLDLLLEKLPI